MKRKTSVTALVLFLFVGTVTTAGALGIVVAPRSALLGDALTVYLPGQNDIRGVTVELRTGNGRVVGSTRAFRYVDGDRTAWVGLLGIPTTISPGTYRIVAAIASSKGIERQEAPIAIGAREFRQENIDLDQNLSDLQTEDTALKARQARDLWHILTTFDDKAVYQFGPLILPVEHYVETSPFAERRLFIFAHGGDESSIHEGIDMAVPAGTPIRAAGAGKVVFDGTWVMTGNTVVIEQLPGVYSLYFHMERAAVTPDEVVKQGQTIGYVGSTGLATGPHLHWQVDVGGVPVDPLSLLESGLLDTSKMPAH